MAVILIVEDDSQNRELMETILKPLGHTIIKACDGREGVAKASKSLPDLILMDIRLPDISGIEVTRQIRAALPGRPLKIIAFTASVFPGDEQSLMENGFDGIIRKPMNLAEFREQVAKALGID